MLENYGYEVIDLGKDVPIETVVETAKKQNIKLIGLSALMTTTVQNMKDTIKAIRESGIDAKVIVGGAVLTEEYAKKIDATPADIAISTNGGYPLDQNIYQSVKGMTAAEATCKEGGVIIMIAACNDGHGGQSFYDNIAEASSPSEILKRVRSVDKGDTVPDQWEFQILARILEKYTVIMVTDQCDPQMIKNMHMKHAYNFDEALKMAYEIKGNDAKVVVIPDGVSVIVK